MKTGKLMLQYEGLNPSGSFKDNGMTAAFTHAHRPSRAEARCVRLDRKHQRIAGDVRWARPASRAGLYRLGEKSPSENSARALDYGALTLCKSRAILTIVSGESGKSPSICPNWAFT